MNINLNDIESRILQSKDDFKNIAILEKKFKTETKKCGDILVKEIFRLNMSYKKDGKKYKKSFFLKVPYNNPYYEKMYSREIKIYTSLFPQYKLLLPNYLFHPEFFGTDENDVLILEDLSQSVYQKAENQQLNLKQFIVALKKLAKFHSLGIKIQETQPEILNDIQNTDVPSIFDLIFSTPDRKLLFIKQFQEIVGRTDATFAEEHPEVLLYFENYLPQMPKNVQKLNDKFNVLNHGNIYSENIWFAYDLGEVVDAKFTNFQYCHWGSPIIDIILFIITSLPFEIFDKNFDTLLELYTSTINAKLEKLKCDQRLNVDDLRGQIDSNYEYFLYILVAIAPEYKKVLDSGSDKYASKDYINEESYKKQSKLWMSYFIKRGIFLKHEDIAITINTCIKTFEVENKTTILSYDLNRSAVKPGDNYTSLIVRLCFEYKKGEENTRSSVLLKIPSLSLNDDDMKNTNIYNHEIFIYQKIFPELYHQWKGEPFAPVCYTISKAKILVLEDLSIQGFRLCDKKKQLDLDHCRIALATLARYHATSLKYLQRCDEIIRGQLREPISCSSTLRLRYQTLYSKFLRIMKPLVEDSLYQKIQDFKDKIPGDATFGNYMDDSGLNVIGHCDYRTNNILFQYDKDGHVCSAKVVDWQLARLASPAIDLIFFLVTSVRFELFDTYKDALLNFYLDSLNNALSMLEFNLKYPRPDLDEAIQRHKYNFWLYVGTELPFMMTNEECIDDEANSDVESELYVSAALKWVNYLEKENLI